MSYQRTIFGVNVKFKSDSKLINFISLILKPFNPSFMDKQWLTIFSTVYAPIEFEWFADKPEDQIKQFKPIIEHERIHVNDFKKYHIWFLLTYFFPPILFAYGRFFWERKAHLPELQLLIDNHQYSSFNTRLEEICKTLSGPTYFWCWPRSWVRNWFLKQTNMD